MRLSELQSSPYADIDPFTITFTTGNLQTLTFGKRFFQKALCRTLMRISRKTTSLIPTQLPQYCFFYEISQIFDAACRHSKKKTQSTPKLQAHATPARTRGFLDGSDGAAFPDSGRTEGVARTPLLLLCPPHKNYCARKQSSGVEAAYALRQHRDTK